MKQYTERTYDPKDPLLKQYPTPIEPIVGRVAWDEAADRVKKAKKKQKADDSSIIRKAAQQAQFVKTGGQAGAKKREEKMKHKSELK